MDGTPRLSRDGEPVYHYSFLSTFADACVVPERSCIPIPDDVPFDVAALVGLRRVDGRRRRVAHGRGTARRSRGGLRLRRSRALGADGRGRRRSRARHRRRRCAAEARRRAFVRRDRRGRCGRGAPRRPPRPCAKRRAEESTTRSRRPADPRRWRRRSSPRGHAARPCSSASRARTPCCPCRRPRSRGWSAASSARSTARRSPSGTSRDTLDLYRERPPSARPPHLAPAAARGGRARVRADALGRGAAGGARTVNLDELDGRIGEGWSGEAPNGVARQRRAGAPRQPHVRRRDLDVRAPGTRPYTRSRLRRRDAGGLRARVAADADDEQGNRARRPPPDDHLGRSAARDRAGRARRGG